MSIKQLHCNVDGSLSRTQINVSIIIIFNLCLVLAHVIFGGVLTLPVMVMDGLVVLVIYLERWDVRHVELKAGKDGIGLTLGVPRPGGHRGQEYD